MRKLPFFALLLASVPLSASAAGLQADSPALTATFARSADEPDHVAFSVAPGAPAELIVQYPTESGARVRLSIPVPASRKFDWILPADFAPERGEVLASLDGAKSWLPVDAGRGIYVSNASQPPL